MAGSSVTVRDFGFDAVLAGLGDLSGRGVRVGFMGDAPHPNTPFNLPTLAAIHEEGEPSRKIPARPVIRPAADANGPRIADAGARQLAATLVESGAVDKMLGRVGLAMQAEIKAGYVNAFEHVEPLKQATIDARLRRSVGSDHPLIDTGQLVNSVQWQVD